MSERESFARRSNEVEGARPEQLETQASKRPVPKAAVELEGEILQAKMSVGPAGDAYEREADDVAARVVRTLRSAPPTTATGRRRADAADSNPRAQRSERLTPDRGGHGSDDGDAIDLGGRLRKVQRSSSTPPLNTPVTQIRRIQRSATAGGTIGVQGGDLDADTTRVLKASRGGGKPLPDPARSKMESAFGADFSGIRVHSGPTATDLNERIQAKAFTTGNDIYFRDSVPDASTSSGQELLAHELTHTIQQGGASVQRSGQQVIRRVTANDIINQVRVKLDTSRDIAGPEIFNPDQFKKATYTRAHMRGAAVKAVDGYLATWQSTQPNEYLALRKLALQIQYACEQWILDHSVQDAQDGATRKKGEVASNEWLIDPNRKKRFSGMVAMLDATNAKLTYLNKMINDGADSRNGADGRPLLEGLEGAGELSKAHEKLKVKYEGDPGSTLAKLGGLIEMAVPNAGDATEIEVAFRWPVEPSGIAFVGGTLRLKAENSSPPGSSAGAQDAKNILARMEVVFTVGAQGMNVGKIQAELGGYIEGSAKTGRECMILMSYALFRKFRENSVIPSGATNYLWGGRAGTFGALKAEKWGKQVETGVFGKNEGGYVETGLLGGVGGDIELGNDQIGGGMSAKLRGGVGTRYDTESIKLAKGALGAANEKRKESDVFFAQKQLGRDVRFFEFEVEGAIGPFEGAVGFRLQLSWSGMGADGTPEWELTAAEFELKAGATVANVGGDELGERIAGWATEGVRKHVSLLRGAMEAHKDRATADPAPNRSPEDIKAERTPQQKKEASLSWIKGESWGTLMDSLDQLGNVDAIETLGTPNASTANWMGGDVDSTLANNASFGQALGERSLESTVGLQLVFGGDLLENEYMFSINVEKAREFKIPMFLDISQKSTSRLIAFRKVKGKWTVV
jgi:hypothetical protein